MEEHHQGAYTYIGEAPVVEDINRWRIDTGPWKDRFDRFGYAGLKGTVLALSRTNDICYAAVADLSDRKYVDLLVRRAELVPVLQAIAAVVLAAGKPAFTTAMQNAMLDTPVDLWENEALRKG